MRVVWEVGDWCTVLLSSSKVVRYLSEVCLGPLPHFVHFFVDSETLHSLDY